MKNPLCHLGWLMSAMLLLGVTCREVRPRPVVRPEPTRVAAPSPVDVNAELRDELAACLRQNDFGTNEKIDEEGDDDEKRSEWAEAQRETALGVVDACPV